MNRTSRLDHEFVHYIPDRIDEGKLYVSVTFATVVHRCCCGCGNEVVTPLSPTDWQLTFDGESVSLDPSIGNWSFTCRSHYWIRRGRVHWARAWSKEQIQAGRVQDRRSKEQYFAETPRQFAPKPHVAETPQVADSDDGFWRRLTRWWRAPGGKRRGAGLR
jgi:hypothetical protein